MKNDLSDVKVGDWIWTIPEEWVKVINIIYNSYFYIRTENNSYSKSGELSGVHKYPSVFIDPPECFNPEPKPCELKKGDKVLAWYEGDRDVAPIRKYFAGYSKDEGLPYLVYISGDEWTSEGRTVGYSHCKKWED
jgi:hypothetical protein